MLAIVRRGKKRREEGRRVVGALRERRRARLVVAIIVTAGIWIEIFYVKIFSPSFYQVFVELSAENVEWMNDNWGQHDGS